MSLNKQYANKTYTPEQIAAIDDALDASIAGAEILPAEETALLKRLAKIGLKSESFAREALMVAKLYPNLIPRGLNMDRMEVNLRNRDRLQDLFAKVEQIRARVRAALILHGVDAYADGLTVYNSMRRHADTSSQEAVDRLGRAFRRTSEEEELEPAAGIPAEATVAQP